jgi:hypothetical protein
LPKLCLAAPESLDSKFPRRYIFLHANPVLSPGEFNACDSHFGKEGSAVLLVVPLALPESVD